MKEMNEDNIEMFLHCGRCIKELKENPDMSATISPKDYSKVQAGWTKKGLQVWCNRHDCNILHIDFEGNTHPADTTYKK